MWGRADKKKDEEEEVNEGRNESQREREGCTERERGQRRLLASKQRHVCIKSNVWRNNGSQGNTLHNAKFKKDAKALENILPKKINGFEVGQHKNNMRGNYSAQ